MKQASFIITEEVATAIIERTKAVSWENTPHSERQVYAALERVPQSFCKNSHCPFFELFKGGNNNYNQPGACYAHRSGAKDRGMEGIPKCYTYKGKRDVC